MSGFHGDKSFWPCFPGVIVFAKPRRTVYKVSKGVLTNSVEVVTWFLWDIGCYWKHKFLKKERQTSQLRKDSVLYCLVLLNLINVKKLFERVHKVLLHFCANDKIISLGLKRSIETIISKNIFFHGVESFWTFFLLIIE